MPGFEGRIFNSDGFNAWLQEEAIYNQASVQMPSMTMNYNLYNEDYVRKMKKQIDRMAEFINKMDVDEEICSKVKLGICEQYNNGNCKECIKKFFEEE